MDLLLIYGLINRRNKSYIVSEFYLKRRYNKDKAYNIFIL